MNMEETAHNMLQAERAIDRPAYEYIWNEAMVKEVKEIERRKEEKMGANAVHIRYRSKNQIQEEKEELAIAGEFDSAKSLQDLGTLLREGKMKEFYEVANRLMRIKRSNPVVTKVRRENAAGEPEIFEEKVLVE